MRFVSRPLSHMSCVTSFVSYVLCHVSCVLSLGLSCPYGRVVSLSRPKAGSVAASFHFLGMHEPTPVFINHPVSATQPASRSSARSAARLDTEAHMPHLESPRKSATTSPSWDTLSPQLHSTVTISALLDSPRTPSPPRCLSPWTWGFTGCMIECGKAVQLASRGLTYNLHHAGALMPP